MEQAIHFLAIHPHLAYWLVLLLACSESLPLVGAVFPGTIIIVALSALIPSGTLKLYPMLAAAFFGAITGDGLSFWLGRRFGEEAFRLWPIRHYPSARQATELFIQRHGGKSVFLARFLPALRAFVPLVAGMSHMKPGRFYVANILSAMVWAPAHVIPGLVAATVAAYLGANSLKLTIAVSALALALWFAWRIIGSSIRYLLPLAIDTIDKVRNWSARRTDLAGRLTLALVNPNRNEPPTLAILVSVLICAGWLFFGIAEDVVNGDPLVSFDRSVFELIRAYRTTALDGLIVAVTELGDTPVVIAVAAATLAFLLLRRSWRTAAYFLGAVAGGSMFNTMIKATVQRARPTSDLYTGYSNFSFPSGHSTENAVLYGFLAYLVCRCLSTRLKIATVLAAVSLVSAIAFSRVYLGAHWFSDVAAGLTFAVAWLTVLMIASENHGSAREATRGLFVVACAALLVAGSLHVRRMHAADVGRYAVREEVPAISLDAWLDGAWRDQPVERVDLTGEPEEPFILQWAGRLSDLQHQVQVDGWQVPPRWTFSSASEFLTLSPAIARLPVLPSLEQGKLPALTLSKNSFSSGDKKRYLFSVWRADADISSTLQTPLWLATVSEQTVSAGPLGIPWIRTKGSTTISMLGMTWGNFCRTVSRGHAVAESHGSVLLCSDKSLSSSVSPP